MILLIALDTYYNFRFFSVRDEEGKDRVCGRQLVCLFMLHFLANVLIWLNTGSVTMLAFYGAQVLFFLLYIYLTRLFYRNSSKLLVNNMCTLLATGFIILTRLNPDRAMRQFAIVAVAAVVTWIIPFIIDRVWQLGHVSVGLRDPGACAPRCGVRDRKYFLRSPALPDVRGIYGAAIRVCKDQLCILCGCHVLPVDRPGHDH